MLAVHRFRDLLAPALDFLVASRRKEATEQEEEKRRQKAELEAAREKQATAEHSPANSGG